MHRIAFLLDRFSLQIKNEGFWYIDKNRRRLQKLTFKQLESITTYVIRAVIYAATPFNLRNS